MTGRTPALALVTATTILLGCPSEPPESETGSSVEREGTGAVEGLVRLATGEVLRPRRIRNTTDPAVCGEVHTLEKVLVSEETRGVKNVVVRVALEEETVPAKPERLVLDNRDCRFEPHVSVVTVGSIVEIVNSDPVLHTTHFYGAFDENVALPNEGMRVERTLRRPGLVAVRCDVHGWMQAYVWVGRHRLHDVTDGDGRFRIEGVPPGERTLELWHETLGEERVRVTVETGRIARADVTYSLPEFRHGG